MDEFRGVSRVRLTILQPAMVQQPVRSAEYPLDHMLTWAGELREIVEAAQRPDAPLRPSPKCKFCPAQSTCPAFAQQAAEAMRELSAPRVPLASMFEVLSVPLPSDPAPAPAPAPAPTASRVPLPPPDPADRSSGVFLQEIVESLLQLDPDTEDPQQQSRILEYVPMVQDFLTQLRKRAEKAAMDALTAGRPFPGWRLGPGRRNRTWVIEDEVELSRALARLRFPASQVWERKIRSPSQLEKLAKDSATAEKLAKLWTWSEGAPALVRVEIEEVQPSEPEPEPVTPDIPFWL
jgi:hypothetical protein